MMRSPGLKWLVILVLLPTIAWKFAIKPGTPTDISNAILKFLDDHQFEASVTDKSVESTGIIEATSDSCHLWVARVSPLGFETDLVRRIVASNDHISYVFRGTVYNEQPVNLTTATYLWSRFLRELGLVKQIPPVIAVVSSCNAEHLPWSELRF
ncbi:hypothetical protein [Bradyrhizobium sp. STM 3562]|uniref:hypothetical protein n=1 Tax=Bradyrhizobium sp. STM 3562 TaxID=578924 RepID=UPI00388EC27E